MVNAYTGGVLGPVGVALAFAFVVIAMIYAVGTCPVPISTRRSPWRSGPHGVSRPPWSCLI
jgi:hypothetical protein